MPLLPFTFNLPTSPRTYQIWAAIKQRCLNPNSTNFYLYGGRGITIYPAWIDDFQAFYDYVSTLENFDKEGYSLDRIDNNGNYEPNNLRWGDRKTQARNTRRSVFVDYYGVKMLVTDVAKLTGISENTLRSRARIGLTGEKLFRPVKTFKPKKKFFQSKTTKNNSPIEENLNLPSPKIFNHEEFGKVRVVMIDNVVWFVGKDVADALAYTNPQKAIRDHVDDEDKRSERIVHPLGGAQETILINESGLYSLILSSKLSTAKKFKRWVTSEVLPSIRKTGEYKMKSEPPTENLPYERKIELLMELAKITPDNAQKIELVERIAKLI